MGKEGGFLEFGRKDPGYRPAERRVVDCSAVELRLEDKDLYRQAARCMDCGIPFCHGCGCPLSNVIPEFNDHVYHRRWNEALEILLSTNPFPEFTGRICPAPCETSCVLGINDDPVTIRQVELEIIEAAFEKGLIAPCVPRTRHEAKIAVVGAGPAGMAAADVLNKAGYHVTVFENALHAGGILRYGIPDFKLEKWVVERRVRLMEAEGVRFEMGVRVGVDVSARFLRSRFDAIILTGGAREPRDLPVPGRDLGGIHFAMRYLVQQNKRVSGEALLPDEKEISAAGKNVIVIGGGDTGSDCMGTALRQGAKSVRQYEILPEPPAQRDASTPWPEWPLMRRDSSSHKEGGERRWSVLTESFSGENGHVRMLHGAEVDWKQPKGGNRPVPKKKRGSEFKVDADLVLLAMGFVGPGKSGEFVRQMGVELDDRGFIRRDDEGRTSVADTFVAGDMTRGASLVVRAIADGVATAHSVMKHLS